MSYTLEEKLEIINGKPADTAVRSYCLKAGISYSTYYKWNKELHHQESLLEFVDVTDLADTGNSVIDIELSDITVHVTKDYNENHLLNLLRSLKKL